MSSQSALDLGEPRQNGFAFPVSLVEKYQPALGSFVGLKEAQRILLGLCKKPRPCSLLFIGPPGTGKTIMGLALARKLPAALVHTGAQQCDVAKVDSLWYTFAGYPGTDLDWWLSLVDEADRMTSNAQDRLLSKLDSTAGLRPLFGGGFERGTPPPVIWAFTANGTGPEQSKPPLDLHKRFVERSLIVPFAIPDQQNIASYLRKVWTREGGRAGLPLEYFLDLAEGVSVRGGLQRLDTELLRNPTIKEVRDRLLEKSRRIEARENEEAGKWQAATEIDNDPDVRQAIAAHQDAVDRGMPAATIAAKRAWITIRRNEAKERAS